MKPFLSLGNQALPDWKTEPEWEYAPLDLVECESCGLLQLKEIVPRERLFNERYGYRSGVSETMRAALGEVANKGLSFIDKLDDIWLDIGSNDNYLLQQVAPQCRIAGFEPSMDHSDSPMGGGIIDGNTTFAEPFESQLFLDYFQGRKAKVITSIAMFYSVDTPRQFVADIAEVLAPGGVWICQMNDQQALIENMAYDIIGHEHCCIWSFKAFDQLCKANGLEVFDVERVSINGGGFRAYVSHPGSRGTISPWNITEAVLGQRDRDSLLPKAALQEYVVGHAKELFHLVDSLAAEGKRIHLYGASTRITTMLQAAGIDERYIWMAAERSSEKWGCYVPGTRIPIVSEEESRMAEPDYYLLGIPYVDQVVKREREFLARGGKFITPYGEPRIL